MRHPQVATVGVVFDEYEAAAGAQIAAHELEHRLFVALEVQRVCHHHAVERGQIERASEVSGEVVDRRAGEASAHLLGLRAQRCSVEVPAITDSDTLSLHDALPSCAPA